MELTEAYLFLLADSFMSALVLPFSASLVFPVMKIFGGYSPYFMVILAGLGASAGALADWFFGRFMMIASKYKPEAPRALQFMDFCRNYGKWLLLLLWVPVLGPVIITALGAVGARIKLVMPIIFVVNFVYYSALLLY